MSTVRFRSNGVSLELSGSESFVLRQLQMLSPSLGPVDRSVLAEPAPPPPPEPDPVEENEAAEEPQVEAAQDNGRSESDGFLDFVRAHPPRGRDRQSDAALLFAYYLQCERGQSALRVGDLLRCCIRAGVDTRNFNHALGTLSRRGLFETVRPGKAYRLSPQGVAAVENRT